jgi:hypothetical protein
MAYNQPYYAPYYQPNFYNQNGASPDMLSQMKGQYQPQMQMQAPQMQMPSQSNDMIWVLGEVEATSYPVAPNNTVILWDKNNPTIYIKSANAQGVPSMRILDFVERSQNATKTAEKESFNLDGKFVTIEKFNELQARFDELQDKLSEITTPRQPKKKGDAE